MYLFYLIACIPLIVGMILWILKKNIVWWEWLVSSLLGFITTAVIHIILIVGMTDDIETWSGKVSHAVYHPRWVEEYQEIHTRTVGTGKNARTEIYYTTEHRTHHERWVAFLNFGSMQREREITKQLFDEIKKKFGGKMDVVRGSRSGYHSGDKNDYYARNHTGYIYPVTTTMHFENRIKCAPSVYSYAEVPDDSPVYEWPQNTNWDRSQRLLGAANVISIAEWDRMNTRLGPTKKVNVIMIGFGDVGSEIAQLQEAKWIGGKKNDLVLCFGGPVKRPTWSYVFGWTEREIVKRNLETILLNNQINDDIIPIIEKEVVVNYEIKDWSKFDYISVEPPWWSVMILILTMAIAQTIFLCWAVTNKFNEES